MKIEDVKPGQRVLFDYSQYLRQHETWGYQWEEFADSLPSDTDWWRVDKVEDDKVVICHFTPEQTLWPATVEAEWLTLIKEPAENAFNWRVVMDK